MCSFNRLARMIFTVLAVLFLTAGIALAATTRTITAGTVPGTVGGAVVSVPITIDDSTGVGGIAFTITYDPAALTFLGLEQAAADRTINDPDKEYPSGFKVPVGQIQNYPGTEVPANYYNPYGSEAPYAVVEYTKAAQTTLFYQYNPIKDDGGIPVGRVLVSGASAVSLTGTSLFNAQFTVNAAAVNGTTYPIRLLRSIINNPAAGYAADTLIPVLIGTGTPDPETGKYTSLDFPEIPSQFAAVAGGITVSGATVYSLGGKVTYGASDGSAAAGCTVTLYKETATAGTYAFNAQTTVGATGQYSFTSKAAGKYKITVGSLNPGYDNYSSDTAIELPPDTTTADAVLLAKPQVRLTDTVDSGYIPGLLVKVVNGSTFDSTLMGTYSISAADKTWSSALLPAGGNYHYYLVYGILHSAADAPTFDTTVLKTISGTITGMPDPGTGAVTAVSATGMIMKTVPASNGVTYEIPYLVDASDYIVSVVAAGLPVTYYDGKTDINEANNVNTASLPANGVNFNLIPPVRHIKGQITDNGSGVNGLTVYAFDVDTFAMMQALTQTVGGVDGSYDITVAAGSYEVFVAKGNGKIFYYNEDGTPTQSESGASVLTVSDSDKPGINISITEYDKTLTGKVTKQTATGEPVANALITVSTATELAMGLTGQDGSYSVGGLHEGTVYDVEMKPLTGNYPVQVGTIAIGASNTKDFIIDTGVKLSGTVTSGGAPVPGAMIYLADKTTGALVGGGIYFSGNDGAYSILDVQEGEYTVEVTHPDYKSAKIYKVISYYDDTLDVVLEKGAHFKGTVKNSSSKNLAGVTVIVTCTGAIPVYTVTDLDGFYSVYGLDAGNTYTIFAQKRGYERAFKPSMTPTPGTDETTTNDFTLSTLTSTYAVQGWVTTDALGTPGLEGAIVLVSSTDKNFFVGTQTDSTGKYRVANLVNATDYKIVVLPPGNLPTQKAAFTVANANPSDQNFSIVLGTNIGGVVSGQVPIPAGTKIYVFLYDGDEYVGYARVAADASHQGNYLFKGLTAKSGYKVLVVAAGYVSQWRTGIDTSPSSQNEIDVTLQ